MMHDGARRPYLFGVGAAFSDFTRHLCHGLADSIALFFSPREMQITNLTVLALVGIAVPPKIKRYTPGRLELPHQHPQTHLILEN